MARIGDNSKSGGNSKPGTDREPFRRAVARNIKLKQSNATEFYQGTLSEEPLEPNADMVLD